VGNLHLCARPSKCERVVICLKYFFVKKMILWQLGYFLRMKNSTHQTEQVTYDFHSPSSIDTNTLASGWALRENPDDALLIWKENCHFHMHISKAKLWHVGGLLTCSVLQRTHAWKGALAGCFSITLKTKRCHCVKRDKNNYQYGTVLLLSIILPY